MDADAKIDRFADCLQQLRATIAELFAGRDGEGPDSSSWQSRLGEGSGLLFSAGRVFERAGINISRIAAASLPAAASAARPELAGRAYRACGLSLIAHPRNPYAPTVHLNVRHFCTDDGKVWWFGGGMDLSPCYGFEEDCRHFHRVCRQSVGDDLYADFKRRCDEYFWLSHRGEQRGIGGIFFDDYDAGGDYDAACRLTESVARHFAEAYLPIIDRRAETAYGERERSFQLYRRGRYVEFNLLRDRGTLFGLLSGGNADAILVSMPPLAAWQSGSPALPGSIEARFAGEYLVAREWI